MSLPLKQMPQKLLPRCKGNEPNGGLFSRRPRGIDKRVILRCNFATGCDKETNLEINSSALRRT